MTTAPRSPAWRWILIGLALLAVAAVAGGLHRGPSAGSVLPVLAALGLLGAWIAAVRFILLDTWGRWLCLVSLTLAGVLAATAGNIGLAWAIGLSGLALAARTLQPWRHVGARRRALGFGLGLLALGLLMVALGFRAGDTPTGVLRAIRNLGTWSLWSLVMFWLWSLFHLAVRMRLHFLRLRPKLAVSAVLIGFVPLVLIAALAVLTLYGALGGARGSRARQALETWRTVVDAGGDLSPAVFDTTFVWPEGAAESRGAVLMPTPVWPAAMARGMAREFPSATDTTAWFVADGQVWLLKWRGLAGDSPSVQGWPLGTTPLRRLSKLLQTGVVLQRMGSTNRDEADTTRSTFRVMRESYRDVSDEAEFWSDVRIFGGTLLLLNRWDDGEFATTEVLVKLKVGWRDLWGEFGGNDNLNILLVIVFFALLVLFLVIESFALFFGVRISEGIVAAVHVLHRRTRAVVAGDLTTEIDVPNEDEFGDLAASFNEMIRTIRQGQQDALARERLTRELETARSIQERLLPNAAPILAGFEITGTSVPSREIGGDYFDFLGQDDGTIGLAIGDVSGKGMPAALLMANLQASLQGQVIHPSSVAEVVGRVNNLLVASTDPHMFATFFYGVLDTRTATLVSTNAGHNPPLILRGNGDVETLGTGGLLLGMMPDQVYGQEETHLEPGEVLVLFTDGITEAVGPGADDGDPEAMFGDEALEEVLRRHAHLPAAGIREAILSAVAEHTAGVNQSDDITLVVVRRQG